MTIVLSEAAAAAETDPVAEAARLFVEAAAASSDPYTVGRLQEMVGDMALLQESALSWVKSSLARILGGGDPEKAKAFAAQFKAQFNAGLKAGRFDENNEAILKHLQSKAEAEGAAATARGDGKEAWGKKQQVAYLEGLIQSMKKKKAAA